MYIPLVAFLLLFLAVGIGFIFVHLLAGKFIRPSKPDPEKKTIYECGEPTIGSAWIQFDLRFYVVALLFVIFDVEVAFFFPWAEVFGRANAVAAAPQPQTDAEWQEYGEKLKAVTAPSHPDYEHLSDVEWLKSQNFETARNDAKSLSWMALMEILVFFGVLLVGFAYLWKRGDLQWVRSTLAEQPETAIPPPVEKRELVKSA